MREYHKIDSVYKRDERGNFLIGEFSRPEFEYLKDNPWLWTEKIDGTNIRVMLESDPLDYRFYTVRFGGKTDSAQIPTKLLTYLQDTFPVDNLVAAFGEPSSAGTRVCLYGEGYGAGIQKGGGNYSPDQRFILFDVRIGDWWLERKNVEDIARKLNIPVVPLIQGKDAYFFGPETDGVFALSDMIAMVQNTMSIPNVSPPTSQISPNAFVEGWVGTPLVPLYTRKGDRIITKIKYKDFK